METALLIAISFVGAMMLVIGVHLAFWFGQEGRNNWRTRLIVLALVIFGCSTFKIGAKPLLFPEPPKAPLDNHG